MQEFQKRRNQSQKPKRKGELWQLIQASIGVVKYDGNAIASISSWSFDQTQDAVENTALGQSARSYLTGIIGWSGSAEAFWDETDTAQSQIDTDMGSPAIKTLELYSEGTTSGDTYWHGSVIVTSVSRSASVNGMVTASFSFQGTGGLTKTTV